MQGIKGILNRMKEAFGVETFGDLADKLEVSSSSIDSWRARGSVPEKNILKTSQMCGVSSEWLLKGGSLKVKQEKLSQETITINFYHDTTAAAGYGCINGDELPEPLEISRSFLANILGLKVFKNLDIIGVQGDSMEPFISNGEYVIVERTDEARNNEIVIANVNGEVYVKRLLRDPFQKWVKLISSNKSYEDIMLKDDELQYINIIGVVRAKFRPF